MPPKRTSKAAAKGEDAIQPAPAKRKINLSKLKKELWDHYDRINVKINEKNRKPLDGEELGIQRHAEDEDLDHEHLLESRILEPYENIYDYDYDVDIAKEIFKKNTKGYDDDEYTPLIWAIKLSLKDDIRDIELMCKYFLKKDENGEIDKVHSILTLDEEGGWNKSTALHKAAEYGRVDVIEFLMNEGADVNIVNSGKFTPFMLAARDGKHEVVEKIIKMSKVKGIRLQIFHNDKDRGRFTDLALACTRSESEGGKTRTDSGGYVKVVNLILNHTDDDRARKILIAPNKFGKTPLLVACENGQKEIVKLIIEKMKALFTEDVFELEINRFSFVGKSALHLAIADNPNKRVKSSLDNDTTIIALLLENGAWSDRIDCCSVEESNPKYKWQRVYEYMINNLDREIYQEINKETHVLEDDVELRDLIKFHKQGFKKDSALTILCKNPFFMNERRKIAIFKLLKANALKNKENNSEMFKEERVRDHNIGQLCETYEPKYYKEKEIELLIEMLVCISQESSVDVHNTYKLILETDDNGKNCLHKACSKGNIGVISVLIDRIIESIQREENVLSGSFTKVLATRKFMEMSYLNQKDHNNMSPMDYLCQYYSKSDHHRKDIEYLFEVALDGTEHKFYLFDMFPKILNALPNPSIIMNDEMMEFIFVKLFRSRNNHLSKTYFHYGKYSDVALFDTLVNVAAALKYCAREKQMGRQILEKKADKVTKMIVTCIESQSMDYASNIADLFRYGLDVRELDANETTVTEEGHDVSELRLALTLMSGPLRKCIEYDLIDVLGTAQISPYIEKIFTINLKKGVVKPISNTTNLIQIRSHCLYYRYCPIIMFLLECLSKIFFFALVVIVSMKPSEIKSSPTYSNSEILLVFYLFGGIMYNCSAVFNELEYRSDMKAREQISIKLLIAVAIFMGVIYCNKTLNEALIFTVIYGIFVWLPYLIKCWRVKGHKLATYGSFYSFIDDNYNYWLKGFLIKSLQFSFRDPWNFLESISLILVFIWFAQQELSSNQSFLNLLLSQMPNMKADYGISTSLATLIGACATCLTLIIDIINYVMIHCLPWGIGTFMLDFYRGIMQWIHVHMVSPMDIFGVVTNFMLNVSATTSGQRFILSLTKITLAFHILRSMLYVEIYGSLTMSLFEMMKDVQAFLVVFVIPFTGFAFAAYSMIGYSSSEESLKLLPDEILSVRKVLQIFLPSENDTLQNDTSSYESSDGTPPPVDVFTGAVLKIILVTFQVVISVVLTNLLIARMTKSYEKIEISAFNKWIASKAKVTMDLLLVQERPSARMLPPPLNIITINISIFEAIFITIWKDICDMKDAVVGIESLTLNNIQKHNDLAYNRSISSSMGRDDHVGRMSVGRMSNKLWNDCCKICRSKYWWPSFKDTRGNGINFSITSYVADIIVCLISLPFTPFYEILLLSTEITKATITSTYKVLMQLCIFSCSPLFYSIYIGVIIKELILRLRTSVTRIVSSNSAFSESTQKEAKIKEFKNVKEVFWGTLIKESSGEGGDDGGNIFDTIQSMYRGWFKASYGVLSFIASISGNCVNMYTLINFIYSYKSDGSHYLFSQLIQLIISWVKTHLVAIVAEFFLVSFRALYDYIYATSTNTKQSPYAPDAYQPSTSDLDKIKEYYNGSLKVKIERLVIEDPLPLSRGVELSPVIRPYVVVYFGNNGNDSKNNESRRMTKTVTLEKNKKGYFKVDIYEELWFKNEREDDPSLKFVVFNRHIGDSNGSGKDSEPLYHAVISDFEEWISNGIYLGRAELCRCGHDEKLENCYIQVTFEVKYSKESNIYSSNLHRLNSHGNKAKASNKSDKRKRNTLPEPSLARQNSNTTFSDGTKEKYKNDSDSQFFEGYNNEKEMFKGCGISTKRDVDGIDIEFDGHIGEYNEESHEWNISSWKSRRHHVEDTRFDELNLSKVISKEDLLKDDVYKVYKVSKKNKDVSNTYQFFRRLERDDMIEEVQGHLDLKKISKLE